VHLWAWCKLWRQVILGQDSSKSWYLLLQVISAY
jgi:hypothetical protein